VARRGLEASRRPSKPGREEAESTPWGGPYPPPSAAAVARELRDLRDLLRHRVALTRMRSALKQRVGAILAKHGIQRPYSNLFGPGGMRFLTELELRDGPRWRLDSLLALISDFDREIDQPAPRSTGAPRPTCMSRCFARSAASAATSPCW